jgi:hypothetical protein
MSAQRAVRPVARGWAWFYPLAILIAAGMILLSLGPAPFASRGAPVAAATTPQGLTIGPASLAQTVPDVWHTAHIVRGPAGAPIGFRLAVKPGAPAEIEGARLALAPSTGQALSDRPVRLQIRFKRIAETGAAGLAARLVGGSGSAWVSVPLPAESPTGGDVVELDLPPAAAVTALELRTISQRTDFASGVELLQVVLSPQG